MYRKPIFQYPDLGPSLHDALDSLRMVQSHVVRIETFLYREQPLMQQSPHPQTSASLKALIENLCGSWFVVPTRDDAVKLLQGSKVNFGVVSMSGGDVFMSSGEIRGGRAEMTQKQFHLQLQCNQFNADAVMVDATEQRTEEDTGKLKAKIDMVKKSLQAETNREEHLRLKLRNASQAHQQANSDTHALTQQVKTLQDILKLLQVHGLFWPMIGCARLMPKKS